MPLNDTILYRTDDDRFAPVTNANKHLIPDDRLHVRPGLGPHPLIRVRLNVILSGTHPGSSVDATRAITAFNEDTGNEEDIYDTLGIPSLRNVKLLYNNCTREIEFAANCLAANRDEGLLYISWSQASLDIMHKHQTISAIYGSHECAVVVPRHYELPQLPVLQRFLEVLPEHEGRWFSDIALIEPMPDRTFATIDKVTVLAKSDSRLSDREKALLEIGAGLVRYHGPQPATVKRAPYEESPPRHGPN